jgi:hypothetical protein
MRHINVLVIAPNFHGYGENITLELKKAGQNAKCLTFQQGSQYSISSLLIMIFGLFYRHLFFFFLKLGSIKVDKVLIIRGDFLSQYEMNILKSSSTDMYLWLMDPISRLKNLDVRPYKKVFSFDKYDSEVSGFSYLPLFSSFSKINNARLRDNKKILFIGSIYGDRLEKIRNLSLELKDYTIDVWGGFSIFKFMDYIRLKKTLIDYGNIKLRFGVINIKKLPVLANSYTYVFNSIPQDQLGLNMRFYEAVSVDIKQITHRDDHLILVYDSLRNDTGNNRQITKRVSGSFVELTTKKSDRKTASACVNLILGLVS